MATSVVLGVIVGIIMGLTGAGGGILAVPLLVFGLHMTVPQAGPIGLMAVGLAAAIGAILGLKAKEVRYRAALLIAGAGVVTAPGGVWLAQRVNTDYLSVLFGFVLLFVGYKSYRQATLPDSAKDGNHDVDLPCIRNMQSGRFIWTAKCARALALSGALAGLLSGLLGVGGGFVMVPALERYTDLVTKSIISTSLAVIALISLFGVAASVSTGNFNFEVGLPFALGAVGGMLGARWLSAYLPSHVLKKTFAAICVAVAAGMMLR